VISMLQKGLDDKKRAVRREAVKARNLWYVCYGEGWGGGRGEARRR
jgi:hypothetical protein